MEQIVEKYINPLTDFGFKRIFGTEFNKELLISFLNALFEGEQEVEDVNYLNSEVFGANEVARKAIFDVYCQTVDGGKFIVEMQNAYQEFYKDRSIYYSSFPINQQGRKGDWNYELQPVYTIGILNFSLPEDRNNPASLYREVKLMDIKTHEVFYDKLTYLYIELEKFKKTETELETMLDKWLFVLKNLSNLMSRPAQLQERVFTKLFEAAEIAKFDSNELRSYEQSINAYRDIKNSLDTASKEGFTKGKIEGKAEGFVEGMEKGMEKGMERGKAEGRADTAKKMKIKGFDLNLISDITGLSIEEIKKL